MFPNPHEMNNELIEDRQPSPDVGRVVALGPRQEVCPHDLLGVVGRDLPHRRVGLVTSAGQLQVEVAAAAVHLQHLHNGQLEVIVSSTK